MHTSRHALSAAWEVWINVVCDGTRKMTLVIAAGGLWAEQLSARNNVRARRSKSIKRTRGRARDDNLLFVRDTCPDKGTVHKICTLWKKRGEALGELSHVPPTDNPIYTVWIFKRDSLPLSPDCHNYFGEYLCVESESQKFLTNKSYILQRCFMQNMQIFIISIKRLKYLLSQ